MNSLASDYKFRKQQLQYVDSLYFRNNAFKIDSSGIFGHKKRKIKIEEIDSSQVQMKQQLKSFLEKQIEEKKLQREKEFQLKRQLDAAEEIKLKKYQESIKQLYYEQQPTPKPKQEEKEEKKSPPEKVKKVRLQETIHLDEMKLQMLKEKERQFHNYYMIRDHLRGVLQSHSRKLGKIFSAEREEGSGDLSGSSNQTLTSRVIRESPSPMRKTILVRRKSIKDIIREIDCIMNKG